MTTCSESAVNVIAPVRGLGPGLGLGLGPVWPGSGPGPAPGWHVEMDAYEAFGYCFSVLWPAPFHRA